VQPKGDFVTKGRWVIGSDLAWFKNPKPLEFRIAKAAKKIRRYERVEAQCKITPKRIYVVDIINANLEISINIFIIPLT
jgi:hypothetical protein